MSSVLFTNCQQKYLQRRKTLKTQDKTLENILAKLNQKTGLQFTQSQIAKTLDVSRQYISQMKGKEMPLNYIEQLENVYAVKLLDEHADDCIELEHIHINPSCGKGTVVIDEAVVTHIRIGKDIISNVWKSAPENIKVFRASGDSMSPLIEDEDLLIVDTAKTDYNNGGVFLLTINNDWFIKRLRLRVTGELDIISDNTRYEVETLKPNTDIEIKVVGRVIKNLSRGL